MKRETRFVLAALAAFTLAACSTVDPLAPEDSKITPSGGDDTPASTTGVDLKGILESSNKTAWAAGDQAVISDGVTTVTVSASQAGAEATFACPTLKTNATYMAYWPAADEPEISSEGIRVTLPATQQAVESIDGLVKLAGKSGEARIAFDDVFSYVGFSTSIEGVQKIVFTSDQNMAGEVLISFDGTSPVATLEEGVKSVEVQGPFDAGKTYYFTVAPGFVSEITAVASTESANFTIEAEPVDFLVGKASEIPVMDQPNPLKGIYKISHMWVYGGTGPEYGGGGVKDLYDVANSFVSALGRGIEAEADNYIEVLQDGTMYNWAGMDGKNSRFVWKASENLKEKGYPIELEKFYRKIPKGQSSVSVSETGEVTFTDAAGNSVAGQYVPAGTYSHTADSRTYNVTISTVAVKFVIDNGTDDWSNMYNSWNYVAAKPRAFYVELEPMPAGFTVPDAAKTVETIPEDEVLDPDEPVHSDFDFSQFPGSWGFDNASSDLKVLGGCGSDPAFVGPVEKAWDWNDSIYWIGDDRVEVSNEGGQWYFNYWAGNDGKFWDCVWKGTGEDLSFRYGLLPKGKHGVSIDMNTFELTFDNGQKARLYTQGTYQFSEFKKEATVPEGCFAIWFDFGAPAGGYDENDQHWNDIDRFVYSPHGYLMIFHKK